MVKLNILAGTNAAFIASYIFDSVSKSLTLVKKNPSGQNPSWIERSVVNPSILYAVNEIEAGTVQSFTILNNGALSSALSSVDTGGNGPAHVFAMPSGEISAMNFAGGNGVIVRTTDNGTKFGDSTKLTFPVVSPSNVSHPHQTIQYKDELFIPDLGGNTIWRLTPNANGVFSIGGQIKQPPGSGPRHAVIHDNILVVLHELSNTITSQSIPVLNQDISVIFSNISIIPQDQADLDGASFGAAEVLIPETNDAFPSTLVYASNRNLRNNDDRGDSITILSLDADGKLEIVKQFFTGLKQIRGMQFCGPDNRFLVAGGVAGDAGVIVFERVQKGQDFTRVASNKEIPTLASFVVV